MLKIDGARSYDLDTERFAELAMTGTVDDAVFLLRTALDNANTLYAEEFNVKLTDDQLRARVEKIREPFHFCGEQLNLF